MNKFDNILNCDEVLNYYDNFLTNNWKGTPFEKYPLIDPKQKGVLGEMIVEKIMRSEGHTVKPPTDTGHDRIINNKKINSAFSMIFSFFCNLI